MGLARGASAARAGTSSARRWRRSSSGPVFEIHGGGIDLRFPHHENELAQSRGAGREFAQLWAHNGMLELAQEKMSKSLGNIVSLRDVLDALRARGDPAPLPRRALPQPGRVLGRGDGGGEDAGRGLPHRLPRRRPRARARLPGTTFAAALDDDFNTPLALSILHAWRSAGELELLARGLAIFGLGVEEAGEAPAEVVRARRGPARRLVRKGDFARADELRAEIEQLGWEVQDVPDGFRLIPKA